MAHESRAAGTGDRFDDLRAYVFDLVIGVLWLSGIFFAIPPSIVVEHYISILATSRNAPHVPDLVVGFILVISGVVLPYCVAAAAKPFSTLFLDLGYNFHRRLNAKLRRWKQRPAGETDRQDGRTASLKKLAEDRIRSAIGFRGVINREVLVTYVASENPALARRLGKDRDEIWFRAEALLPTAFIFGMLSFRLIGLWPPSVLVGLSILVVGDRHTNRRLNVWNDVVWSAVLLQKGQSSG
jgi:hypothetical protein